MIEYSKTYNEPFKKGVKFLMSLNKFGSNIEMKKKVEGKTYFQVQIREPMFNKSEFF